ncbi:hypothetical protein NNL21_21330 [Paenibacillus mendelii]|nr:hypothetical protein [Paenibacillus mendelii]
MIFWNHAGREHGGLEYADDIRKNSPQVIEQCLALREQRCRENKQPNRYLRVDDSTLIELPPLQSDKRFILIYCLDSGLQLSLNYKTNHPWWLIDIVDIQEIRPHVFCVHDWFIDISVNPDGSYHVYDMDDFELAVRLQVLSPEQISQCLKSFHAILTELNSGSFPSPFVEELRETYMFKCHMDKGDTSFGIQQKDR